LLVVFFLLALVLPAVTEALFGNGVSTAAPPPKSLIATAAAPSVASENGANDYLLSLPLKGRAGMLGKVVGEGCSGKTTFYMGRMDDYPHKEPPLSGGEHSAFWSVKRTNGRSLLLRL
jgi:hypothetical protein